MQPMAAQLKKFLDGKNVRVWTRDHSCDIMAKNGCFCP